MVRRKLWTSLILFFCMALLSACSSSCAVQEKATKTADVADKGEIREFVSDFGYSLYYDPAVCFVLTDNNSDSFGFWDEDADAELSVDINVGRVRGYTVKEYADKITKSIDGGVWSLTEAEFGAEDETATTVAYEEKSDDGTIYYNETLIKDGKDILVVEVVTYEGLPDELNQIINDMLATFTVN